MRFIAIDLLACRQAGLSVEEWCILQLLCCKNIDEAASALGINKRSLLGKLAKLKEKGYVRNDDVWCISPSIKDYFCGDGMMSSVQPEQQEAQKKDKFERILDALRQHIEVKESIVPILKDFYDYRRDIKKPINTYRPLLSYLRSLKEIKEAGYDVQQAIDLMKEREWQTLTLEYVEKTLPKQQTFRW